MDAAPLSARSSCPCPVCGSAAGFWFAHPDADIHRCAACTHTFSRLDTVRRFEDYGEAYFAEDHKNWCACPNKALFTWIDRHLPPDASAVLDAGCGNGDFLRYLVHRHPATRLVGVDLSVPPPVDGVTMISGDLFSVDLGRPFDAVTSLAVIEHVPDPGAYVTRLVDLTSPGGTVIVMTLNADGVPYLVARAARRVGVTVASDRLYSTHHLHHFTTPSLRRVLEQHGLRVERVHHHGAPLGAIDLPAGGRLVRGALLAGVAASFALGWSMRRSFLQTMVCRRN